VADCFLEESSFLKVSLILLMKFVKMEVLVCVLLLFGGKWELKIRTIGLI